MTRALAVMAIVAWSLGAASTPWMARIWLLAGRKPLALIVFGALLVGDIAWLFKTATGGLTALLDPMGHDAGWSEWMLGIVGTVALAGGLRGLARKNGTAVSPPADPDSAFHVALGFFGLGYLFRQLAIVL